MLFGDSPNISIQLLSRLNKLFQKFQNEEVEISLTQIEDEINSEQAKADALRAANPRAMQHYGQRLAEVR
jgi:hypothetical protein